MPSAPQRSTGRPGQTQIRRLHPERNRLTLRCRRRSDADTPRVLVGTEPRTARVQTRRVVCSCARTSRKGPPRSTAPAPRRISPSATRKRQLHSHTAARTSFWPSR